MPPRNTKSTELRSFHSCLLLQLPHTEFFFLAKKKISGDSRKNQSFCLYYLKLGSSTEAKPFQFARPAGPKRTLDSIWVPQGSMVTVHVHSRCANHETCTLGWQQSTLNTPPMYPWSGIYLYQKNKVHEYTSVTGRQCLDVCQGHSRTQGRSLSEVCSWTEIKWLFIVVFNIYIVFKNELFCGLSLILVLCQMHLFFLNHHISELGDETLNGKCYLQAITKER